MAQPGWDANGSPVEDEAEPEPTPEQRIAQFTQSVNAMEAALKAEGVKVDIGQVNIADVRVFAIAAAALRLLQAKGLVSAEEIELATLSVLQEFLGGMLIQMEAKRDTAPKPAPPKGPELFVPRGARLRRVRD